MSAACQLTEKTLLSSQSCRRSRSQTLTTMVEEHRTGMKTACRADQHGWLASWQLRAALTEKTPLSSQSASGGDQNDRTASWQLRATLTEKTRALSTQSCRRSRLQTITSMD